MKEFIEKQDFEQIKKLLDYSFKNADLRQLSRQEMIDLGCLNDYLCGMELGLFDDANYDVNIKICIHRFCLVMNHLYFKDFNELESLKLVKSFIDM